MTKRGRTAQARLHALWTLAGLNNLNDQDILVGLKDRAADVRANAVKLAEQRITLLARSTREEAQTSPTPSASVPLTPALSPKERENRSQSSAKSEGSVLSNARPNVPPLPKGEGRGEGEGSGLTTPGGQLVTELLALAFDPDAGVRFQLAFALGEISDPHAADALATIAMRDAADPWIRTAVLSSVANTSDQLLARLLADTKFVSSSAAAELIRELARIVGVRGQTQEMQRVLTSASVRSPRPLGGEGQSEGALREVASGISEGLKRSGKSLRRVEWDAETSPAVDRLLSQAARTVADSQAPLDARVAAIRFLPFDDFEKVKEVLTDLLAPKQPQEIQRAAVVALSSFSQPDVAKLLLSGWRTYTPGIRGEVINALLDARSRIPVLLDAIEGGLVPANQVPFARRTALLRAADAPTKERLNKMFVANAASRKDVIAKYQDALSLKGDAARGQKVFEAACATCHRAGDIGKDVGPNLASIRQWNPDQMLVNILDPNREVAPNFVGYTVETKDGRTLDGIITDESAASVTLKRAEGVTETVLRRDIAQLSGSGLSLMPEGVETAITVEQMADLIAFLLLPP